MSEPWKDEELSGAFARLRERDAGRAPDLDAMLSRRPRAVDSRARRSVWPVFPLAAAALLALLVVRGGGDRRFQDAVTAWTESVAGGAWTSPTDFLLDVPGQEFMTTVPRIGVTRAWPVDPVVERETGSLADTTGGDR